MYEQMPEIEVFVILRVLHGDRFGGAASGSVCESFMIGAPMKGICTQKRKRPRLIESWDARRTALPRSLLTNRLASPRMTVNGSNVPITE
jgi:hypothetical protein